MTPICVVHAPRSGKKPAEDLSFFCGWSLGTNMLREIFTATLRLCERSALLSLH